MWFFGKEKSKSTVIYAAISGALGLFINFVIGHIYYEPRPFVTHKGVHLLISHSADASFPSDHTTGAFSIALVVFLRRHRIGLGMLLFAILTGFSRIYVGHHYPFDVLGGIVVALVVSNIICRFSPILQPISTGIINIYNRVPFVPKDVQSEGKTRHY
jgi:undecaprenyl-diphosphatase